MSTGIGEVRRSSGLSVMFPTRATGSPPPLFLGAIWVRPNPFRRHRNKSATERRSASDDEVERALLTNFLAIDPDAQLFRSTDASPVGTAPTHGRRARTIHA